MLARYLTAQPTCDLKELIVGEATGRPGTTVEVQVFGGVSCEVTGFSLAIGHDLAALEFLDGTPGPFLEAYLPDDLFFQATGQTSGNDVYVVIFAVFDLSPPITVPPTTIEQGTVLATLRYAISPTAPPGATSLLNRTREYGDPNPVSNVYSGKPGEAPIEPELMDGAVNIIEEMGVAFIRGDSNNDSAVDISDVVFLLLHLFKGGAQFVCPEAADFNDDSSIDLSDAVFLMNAMFAAGPVLPAPFPECGDDPGGAPCLESACNS